jgi:hypothetical protein
MMLFFFKKKPVVLDCFTYNSTVHDFLPIDYATKFYPDWWKKLPKDYRSRDMIVPINTMKSCKGLTDFYKRGVVIPMWEDVYIKLSSVKEQTFLWQTQSNGHLASHASEHWTGFLPKNQYRHLKLESPWTIKTKEFVQFAFVQPLYNQEEPNNYVFCPGVVDFKYQHGSHINIMVDFRMEPREFTIKAGTPGVMMIPMFDQEIKIKNHLVDHSEWMKVSNFPVTFNGHWPFRKRQQDKKDAEAKCPFHFWKNND